MKKSFILAVLFLFSILLNAQNNKATLVSSTIDETFINFTFQSYDFKTVATQKGEAVIVLAEDMSAIMELGAPNLPKFTESLIIPDLASMKVEVLSSKYKDVKNVTVAPSKGNLTRNIDPATISYQYGSVYHKDAFYPSQLTDLNEPFILRDHRGQVLQVFPFQYNPVSKTLRVYSEIKLKVSVKDQSGVNPFNRTKSRAKVTKEFNKIYTNHFINYQASQSRYTPVEEEGNMLIICHDAWTAEMEAFVTWKNTIGRPCEMVTVTDAGGTATNIKTYVENYYNTNGLTFLLLVGDSNQVPTNIGGDLGGHSDNAYAYITGNDHYLEFFVGRFSAETAAHVTTQVLRTYEYEKGDQLAADWLNKCMSVGSDEGGPGFGDDGEYDWEHLRNIQTDLIGFSYINPPYEHFEGSQGGEDAAGNPTPAQVAVSLNAGLGIANYTGHGSDTSWSTSGFSNSDINNLTNENKLPFIWTVACVNGAFVGQTCFGEAWLRAENNGEPTGAVAIMAATINQTWAPPMIGQDEMNDLLVGTAVNGTKRTFGGISINGCFQMIEESNDTPMIDTWTCFGDPSLYVRTDNPTNMVIAHNSEIIVGENVFNVASDLEGALATVSNNGVIVGSAVVTGGNAAIPVDNLVPGTNLTVAVVGFNKITYVTTVIVIAPTGPYVIVDSCVDEVTFGQSIDLDMALKNVGVAEATNVIATLATADASASLTNETYNYGTIAAGAVSSTSSDAFTLAVLDDVPDQYLIPVTAEITDGTETWNKSIFVKVNAPAFTINDLVVDDAATGNSDGILDPGETATLTIQTTNTGHANVTNVISMIATNFAGLTIDTGTAPTVNLTIGETGNFVFSVTADANVPPGTQAIITNTITGGVNNQYSEEKEFAIIIGFVPEYCDSNAADPADSMIEEVQFGTIVNNTAADGCVTYTDFTEQEALTDTFSVGTTHDIKITLGTCGGNYNKAAKVFIDWNYDGDFNDAGEMVFETDAQVATWTAEGTFTVPADINSGQRFMRIVLSENVTAIEPCGEYPYGETEDYKIYVHDPAASVKENNLADLNLYPNPNEGSFVVDLSRVNNNEVAQIEVFNLNGQLVYKVNTTETKPRINLHSKSGIYLVRVTSGTQVTNKKIIVKP